MNLPSTCRQITKGGSLQYFGPLAAFVSLVFCVSAVAQSTIGEAAIKELEKKGFTVTRKGKATNIDAEENMGPNNPFAGTSLDEIGPENNPVDLALRSAALFHEDRKAAHRLALAARLRGGFDTARVSDPSAHEALAFLFSKGGIDDMLMWVKFDPDLERSNIRAATEWAYKTGPPSYAPRWMIQHGVRVLDAAIKGEAIGNGLLPDFDAAAAWAQETQQLLALVEDQAAWITRRQAVTPDALVELVARRKASVCEFLKKSRPRRAKNSRRRLEKLILRWT